MKKIYLLFGLISLIMTVSCSKNQDMETPSPEASLAMAEFNSMEEFNQTVIKLMKATPLEQIEWCRENNIISQYMLYDQAIEELEEIQNLRDTTAYYQSLEQFRSKYSKYFLFNDNDPSDLNPYIPSNDLGNNLVCNAEGNVKIAGEIVNFNELSSFEETTYGKFLKETNASRASGDIVDEKINYLYIKEGGDRKMWAESQRKEENVYIKLSAHKKGWLGGWNNYKTTYRIKYLSHEPRTWFGTTTDFNNLIVAKDYVETKEVSSGYLYHLGVTVYNKTTGVFTKAIASFSCTSRGTDGVFGTLNMDI